jgi:tetratricopeptide (TPR) repeat protein
MSMETLTRAWEVLQDAYQAQMEGDYDRAVELYQSSLELHPTAEAHTFLGWTYHFQGRVEEAIAECKRAIELDPEFGNPYNDIGAYLIELGRFDEAIPWLERATEALRYEPRHFPLQPGARVSRKRDVQPRHALLPGSAGNRAALFTGAPGS